MTAIIAFFFSPLGRWIGGALIIVALIGGIYMKGHSDGSSRVQAKWDAAVQAAIEKGNAARTDAERAISADPDGVRDDFNRDK